MIHKYKSFAGSLTVMQTVFLAVATWVFLDVIFSIGDFLLCLQ